MQSFRSGIILQLSAPESAVRSMVVFVTSVCDAVDGSSTGTEVGHAGQGHRYKEPVALAA
jgi:hypothetical protein